MQNWFACRFLWTCFSRTPCITSSAPPPGRIWLEESPGDPWMWTIHPTGGGLCAPPHPTLGFLSVGCGGESSPLSPLCVPEPERACQLSWRTRKRSSFPGGLFLPEVRHVSASALFQSGFSAPDDHRASPSLVPVSGASRCDDCLMMSLLWSSPCCSCCVAYLKVRDLTNLERCCISSCWVQSGE